MTARDSWPAPKQVAGGVARFASLTLASLVLDRLFSLAFTVTMSAYFGARNELDSYLLAVAGPILLASIGGDLLYTVLLPELIEGERRREPAMSWDVVFWSLAGLFLITVGYTVLWWAGVEVFGANADRTKLLLLGLIASPVIVFGGVSAAAATALIAERRYTAASLRIPLASLVTVLIFWSLFQSVRSPVGLALSLVTGYCVSAIFMIGSLIALRGRPVIRLGPRAALRFFAPLGRASVAQLIAGIVSQASTPVERLVGFGLGPGVISSLNYGRVLVSSPLLVSQSIATAAYPRFISESVSPDAVRHRTLARSIAMVVFLLLPVSVFVAELATPLVQLVYHRGAFDQQAVIRTSTAAAILAAALVPTAVGVVITRYLYARRAFAQVAWASVASFLAYVAMVLILGPTVGYVGMAIASTGYFLVLMTSLLLLLARDTGRRLGFLPGRSLLRSALATTVMGLVVSAIAALVGHQSAGLAEFPFLGIAALGGASAYLVASFLLRSPELTEATSSARRLIGRGP
jgi:putative peptidoglycan lipid II flippase